MKEDVQQRFLDSIEHAGAVFCSLPRWQRKALQEIGTDTFFYTSPRHLTRVKKIKRLIQRINNKKLVDLSGNEFINNGFYSERCDNYGVYQIRKSSGGVTAISISEDDFGKIFPVVIPGVLENWESELKELDKSNPYGCSSEYNILDYCEGSVCGFFLQKMNDDAYMTELKQKNSQK